MNSLIKFNKALSLRYLATVAQVNAIKRPLYVKPLVKIISAGDTNGNCVTCTYLYTYLLLPFIHLFSISYIPKTI